MATAMPKKAAPLEVVGPDEKAKLVLLEAPIVAKVDEIAAAAQALVINSAETAQGASNALVELATLAKQIESARVAVKEPFLAMCRRIDDAAKAPAKSLSTAGDGLRRKLSDWQRECERRAAEEERKRQEELARIEAERKKAEEAAKVAANSTSDLADFDVMAAQDDTQRLAQAAATVSATRAVLAPAKPTGVNFREVLKFEVVDVRQLPSSLVVVTPNDAAIRGTYCTGWRTGQPLPSVPGIRFVVEKQTVVSGRR